ncbi:uncharacterized protein METZ01_LOCUS105646 [marine metagenome]|uniref:Uncharacterized protein n=1 Tax=marine metagenome TaxID=408172 RepID=A0A381WK19_9ZZZZ
MKQTLKTLIRNVKSINGNSLAEFATTTALMATLAATAAPKLSEMSEGAKAEKSRNELDKMVKQAGQFYQDTADIEGRGRFPGQDKFNHPVVGAANTYTNDGASVSLSAQITNSTGHESDILDDLGVTGSNGYTHFEDTPSTTWISVFGEANADHPAPAGAASAIEDDTDDLADCNTCPRDADGVAVNTTGLVEWKQLFGGEVVGSQYQDGHFVYQVVAGGGSGVDVYPPVLYVADIENATDFNNVLEP